MISNLTEVNGTRKQAEDSRSPLDKFMSILPHFLRSLLLAITFSFIAPLLLIAVGLITFVLMSHLPIKQNLGTLGCHQMLKFLATFGDGHPLQGCLVIALTFSLVGGLFDTYACCQNFRSN